MFKCIVGISVLFSYVTSEPHVKLSSNLHPGNNSCPREEIIFTCTVNGSRALYWMSVEYIGSGGKQLQFADDSGINTTDNSTIDSGTFAILTNVTETSNNETILLQSELHISRADQSSTVSCFSDVNTTRKNISFTVLAPPDVPKDAAATEFQLDHDHPGTCVLLIDWDPPNFIDSLLTIKQYNICTSVRGIFSQISETKTLATFESPCNEISNITINITAVDICGQGSEPTPNFVPTLAVTSEPPDFTTTTVQTTTTTVQTPSMTTVTTNQVPKPTLWTPGFISGIVGLGFILAVLIWLFIVTVALCCKVGKGQSCKCKNN